MTSTSTSRPGQRQRQRQFYNEESESSESDSDSEDDKVGSQSSQQSSQQTSSALKINPLVKEMQQQNPKIKCNFCDISKIDSLMWGPMYQLQDITVHYFCMLFSAGLSQNGDDHEGILGFMPKDIHKELNRGKKLRCKYCRGPRATVGCSLKTCKSSFHYPCGLKEGSLFHFIGNFESYCVKHRTVTVIELPRRLWECPICFLGFENEDHPIKPPCCTKNNAVYHRHCMMEMARNSGLHFFKCPLCNDKDTFSEAMRHSGVYVPDRDAAWELEPNAFQELNQQYGSCDTEPCLCPQGREFNSQSKDKHHDWKIVRCGGCGAAAVHMKCGGLQNLTYRCDMCKTVLSGTACLGDSEEEEESLRRERNFSPNRSNRISRRCFSDSSDGETERAHNVIDGLDLNDHRTDDEESTTGSTSTSTSKSLAFVKKCEKFGRAYKILGVESGAEDDPDADYDDGDDEEEDEDLILTTTQDGNVSCSGRKTLTNIVDAANAIILNWESRFSYYKKMPLKPNSLNKLNTRPQQFKKRVDKMREFYKQISVDENCSPGARQSKSDISQVRTGLVKAYSTVKGNSVDVLDLVSQTNSNRARPVHSNRSLRNTCKYPNIKEPTNHSLQLERVIARVEELFKEREASASTWTTSSCSSLLDMKKALNETKIISQTTEKPIVEPATFDKIVNAFKESMSMHLPTSVSVSPLKNAALYSSLSSITTKRLLSSAQKQQSIVVEVQNPLITRSILSSSASVASASTVTTETSTRAEHEDTISSKIPNSSDSHSPSSCQNVSEIVYASASTSNDQDQTAANLLKELRSEFKNITEETKMTKNTTKSKSQELTDCDSVQPQTEHQNQKSSSIIDDCDLTDLQIKSPEKPKVSPGPGLDSSFIDLITDNSTISTATETGKTNLEVRTPDPEESNRNPVEPSVSVVDFPTPPTNSNSELPQNCAPTSPSPIESAFESWDTAFNSTTLISDVDVTTILSEPEDDDDCIVLDDSPSESAKTKNPSPKPVKVKEEKVRTESVSLIDDDDCLIDEVIIKKEPGVQEIPQSAPKQATATAFMQFGGSTNNNNSQSLITKYFNGKTQTNLSEAMIKHSVSLMNSSTNKPKPNESKKTNSGSGPPEIVTLDSDEDECTNTKPSTSTSSRSGKDISLPKPKPNRDCDLELISNSNSRRSRKAKERPSDDQDNSEAIQSKRPRV